MTATGRRPELEANELGAVAADLAGAALALARWFSTGATIGTCMVSSEGACAAYYNFGRLHREVAVAMGQRPA